METPLKLHGSNNTSGNEQVTEQVTGEVKATQRFFPEFPWSFFDHHMAVGTWSKMERVNTKETAGSVIRLEFLCCIKFHTIPCKT